MYNILLWGVGRVYDLFCSYINQYNFEIRAVISRDETYCTYIDGYKVITPEES